MNFILYEDDQKFRNVYKNVIYKLLGSNNLNFDIIEFDHYGIENQKQIQGEKIYILDIEVPNKNGIDFAREIRKNGDWVSTIIMVTSHEEFKDIGYASKILILDFICKDSDVYKNLMNTLSIALEIHSIDSSFCFKSHGEIFQIPYMDILYIEKNLNNNFSIVVTNTNKYIIRKTIVQLEEELKNQFYFFKTHRSCIVNLKNITKVDFENNTIYFNKKKINLLSRNNKKKLKKIMEN